jgi:sortase A
VAHQQTTTGSAVPSARRGQEQAVPRRRLRASDVIRKISQILGELLITAGIVLLLFVGWELWWTNVEANAKQTEAVQTFAQEFTGPMTPAAPAEHCGLRPPWWEQPRPRRNDRDHVRSPLRPGLHPPDH